jgi:RNA-directed DNA polymerase
MSSGSYFPPPVRLVEIEKDNGGTLAQFVNPVVRGWVNYYGRFYRSKCVHVLRHLNGALAAWVRRKYKRCRRRERASVHWLGRIARRDARLFVLWQLGVKPEAGL